MSFLDFPDDDPKRRNRRPLLMFIVAALAVGALGSVFTEPNIKGWYATLAQPSIAPPNWLFAPMWTALYGLMAFAAWRAWKVVGLKSPALVAYGAQLFLNLAWNAIFFGLHQIGAALIEIAALWLAIVATMILFWRADKVAGALLLLYLAWVSFASLLNYEFWKLNP